MVAEADDLQLLAWRAVRRTYTKVVRALDPELERRAGMGLRAYEVLVLLSRAPGGASRMSDLASSVLLSPSGLTRLVDQLVARGFIERRQDRSDARAQLAVLSVAGRAACRKATVVYRSCVMDHFGKQLDDGQLRAIVDALEALVSDAGTRPTPKATRFKNPREPSSQARSVEAPRRL